ncbi:unnamed protein product [Cutaneotrichosporon oleaginosum]
MDDFFNYDEEPSVEPADVVNLAVDAATAYPEPAYSYSTQPMSHKPTLSPQVSKPSYAATASLCPARPGGHEPQSRPGLVGVLIAICFFPCGLVALCIDEERKCKHCGYLIEEACCGC